ncbi:MAG: YcaO-like family protein [Kiloniellales bacterium]|nr:YcaO-like family protein [Kiloniellales bacterium]
MSAELKAATRATTPEGAEAADAPKRYRGGTHRALSPRETLEKFLPLRLEMGITRLANVTGLDVLGIPVYMACRPLSRSIAVSQGKGTTCEEAKVSAFMEAAESFHAERIALPLRLASQVELARDYALVDVEGLPRSRLGRFDPLQPILWVEGQDLVSGQSLWLPFEMVSTNYTLPQPPGSYAFAANTNGLASGNLLEEAMLHGLCELIERDAMALWRLEGPAARARTRVRLDSIDAEAARDLLARFESSGVEIGLWDVTSDIGVAAFCCVAVDRDGGNTEPELGAGCHPSREIALLRALSEAAQSRTTRIAGSRDDFAPDSYEQTARTARQAAARDWLSTAPRQDYGAAPDFAGDSIEADLQALLERLQRAGLRQVLGLDLSKHEIGIPVARVIVPGLEGAFPGPGSDYLPGRRAQEKGLAP